MLKVGLTGGLASGKSFVGHGLEQMGCLLIQADQLGHAVLEPDGEAYHAVIAEFGPGFSTRKDASTAAASAPKFSISPSASKTEWAGASAGARTRNGS